MSYRLKRVMSVALAFMLALSLFPIMSVSVRAATPLTTALTFTANTPSVDQIAEYGYKWDKDTLTLKLDGINLSTTAATALTLPADTTIVLADGSTNTITSTYNGTAKTYGIGAGGNLSVIGGNIGTGILTARGGTVTNGSVGNFSCGISSDAGSSTTFTFTMSGGTINTIGGKASGKGTYSYGINFNTFNLTGGTLNATADTAVDYSFGVRAYHTFSMSGGELNANGKSTSGGDGTNYSAGVWVLDIASTFTVSGGILNASGSTTTTASQSYSYGVYSRGANSILDGTVTAKGNTSGFFASPTIGIGATIEGSTDYNGISPVPTTITAAQTTSYKYAKIISTSGVVARTTALNLVGTTISYKTVTGTKSVNPTTTNITDSIEGWTWYKTATGDYGANTLVLKNLYMTNTSTLPLVVPVGATIIVLGDSTITSSNASGVDTYAIKADGNLTIDVAADVTLNLTGGTVSGVGSSGGVKASGHIIKKGAGTLNAVGGNTSQSPYTSFGIYADGYYFIMLDGTVNAIAGTTPGTSRGINAYSITNYNGTVTAKGNTAAFSAVPIVGTGATIIGSTAYAGSNPATITVAQAGTSTYKYVQLNATGGALPRTTALNLTATSLTYMSVTGTKSVNPTTTNITDSLEGWKWYKTIEDGYVANTIILDGINLSTTADKALVLPSSATIILADGSTNTVRSTYTASQSVGLLCNGPLTIDGTGILNVGSGNVSAGSNGSIPVYVEAGGLTINSGTINAISGTSTGAAFGISVFGGLVVNGGTISATANNGSVGNNHGIRIGTGDFTVTGGKITAETGTNSGARYGIYVVSGSFIMTDGQIYAKGPSGGNAMAVSGVITGNLGIFGNSGSAYDISAQFNASNPKVIAAQSDGTSVLDAMIAIKVYTITLNPQSGTDGTTSVMAAYGSAMPAITIPSRDNYTFGGYYASPDGEGTQYYNAVGVSVQAWDQTDDTTLYALWTRNEKATEINDTTTDNGFAVIDSNLDEIIDRILTTSDTNGSNKVTLSLNVTDITGETTEVAAIKTLADKGSDVYFFDVTLKKSVDDGNTGTDTILTNVPVPVEVHIKLTGELAGRSYYRVFRYHNGVAEAISNDPSKPEHYTVDVANSEIIIRTMKFSAYAIFGNDAPIDLGAGYDVDVQAKITGEGGAMYKIDLAWGAMTFEYSTSGVWNPETHSYDSNTAVGWLKEGFMYGNNQMTAWNHSNGDVLVSFDITQNNIMGLTMEINDSNILGGTAAEDMPLGRVPNEGADAESINAYLWLDGEPNNVGDLSTTYTKIAVITATVEAVQGSLLTPQGVTP